MGPTLPDILLPELSLNAWVTSLPHQPCPDGRKEVLAKVHEPSCPGSKRTEECVLGRRGREGREAESVLGTLKQGNEWPACAVMEGKERLGTPGHALPSLAQAICTALQCWHGAPVGSSEHPLSKGGLWVQPMAWGHSGLHSLVPNSRFARSSNRKRR